MTSRFAIACVLALTTPVVAFAADKYELRTFKKTVLGERFFAEGATYGELNNDGKPDLIGGPYWWEGPDFKKQHEFYPAKPFDPKGYSDNFFAFIHDFNGDKWNDILLYGFPGKDASWFENPGKDGEGHWKRHVVFDQVDNESPTWGDLTGDGKPEMIGQFDGFFGYATPDWKAPEKKWTFHKISPKVAGGNFTHGLGWGDVNGDGRHDLLEKNGWWEQPESLEGDPEWKHHPVKFSGPGGAQMYAYDVDGDGLNDVITSLAAHGFGLSWYKQLKGDDGEPKFEAHVITGAKPEDNPYGVKFAELHAIDLIDMNGDGLKDIVTGKRWWSHGREGDPERDAPAVIYWFELRRDKDGEVDWVPHLIDDDSGIGVQVVAGDFSGDGQPDVIVSNKKGTHYHIQQVKEVSKEDFEKAQPRRKMAKSRTPEDAALAMKVPEGFSVKLLAGEPDVQQPIAMAYDDRGRLWIAEAYSYPIRRKPEEAKDRILIFEDTDGNHTLDKRTVFYEGLNLISGMELGFGGVYIGAAPNLLFIPDADGDDKPDGKPQVLLDGWGYEDTHETLNSFIWGPDGWLYGCHGVFTHSKVGKPGTPEEERTKINAGIWRYHPTRHEFEVFAEGTSNPWGVDFNDRGQCFATACVIPHLYHIIQGGRYFRQAGQHFNPYTFDDIKTIAKHRHWVGNQWNDADRARSDSNGGGHAHAGAMFYLGGAWPEQYRNQLFMNNIHGARLNQDVITKTKGSGYEGDAAPDFLFANDVSSQILYMTYGPDGQVTMIDWYDRNQCHHGNAEGHDRSNGRIFKIVHDDAKPVKVDLKELQSHGLVDLLLNSNEWYARHARRILQERAPKGKERDELVRYISELWVYEERDDDQRLRLLWGLHALGEDVLSWADTGGDETINAWVIQLLCEQPNTSTSKALNSYLEKVKQLDTSPLLRMYLASALQRLPLDQRWDHATTLTAHAEDAKDHNLPLMYWYAIEPLVMADTPRAMKLAAESKIPLISRYIVRRAAAEEPGYEALLAHLSDADEETQKWMVEEIVAALKLRANMEMPAAWETAFDKLLARKNAALSEQAEFIAVKFGDERVMPKLRTTLTDRKLDDDRRKLALQALMAGKDKQLPGILRGLLGDDKLRSAAIGSLAAFEDAETPKALLGLYAKLSPTDKQAALATLTSRAEYVLALLDAIEAKQIDRNDLSAFTVRQLGRLDDKRVVARLNDVWGTLRETPADKVEELEKFKKALKPGVLAKANLPHGRELYAKTCGTCHKLFDSGKTIGPDLTGSNRANLDYLLENMLDPSAVIGKDYQLTQIVTTEGRQINGIVKNENATAVTLQTPTDVVTIPKSEIDERELVKLSLMPEGQLKPLPPEDVRDLVAYLAAPAQVPLPGDGPYLDPKTGKVAGAIEGEKIKVLEKTAGATGAQEMGGFPLAKWSGGAQLWWTGAKPGDKLTVEVPVKEDGRYEVFVVATKAVDYGVVKLTFDEAQSTAPIDLFNDGVVTTPPISLGIHDLKKGSHRLVTEITGANDKAVKAYMFAIDYVALIPAKEEKREEK